jgi:hypothetical protein
MTFSAADNDLLLLSDGDCCCSGADLIDARFTSFFRYNYLEACRAGLSRNRITLGSLRDVWRPASSISSHVNSRSRIPAQNGRGAGVEKYIRRNWGGRQNGSSPRMFWGVEPADDVDEDGLPIYEVAADALREYGARRPGGLDAAVAS